MRLSTKKQEEPVTAYDMSQELGGFEVFVPRRFTSDSGSEICMSISKTGCRISVLGLEVLKNPEMVVIFFDRNGKRMMINPGKKGMPNTLKLSKGGTATPNTIMNHSFVREMSKISGIDLLNGLFSVSGYQARSTAPTLIFDLNSIIRKENKNHKSDTKEESNDTGNH